MTAPAANPDLPTRCGVNVMLILDSSGSIGNNAKNVTDAARGFLTALAGTGSQVAIVNFDETATLAVPYNLVTTANINGVFDKYLDSYNANGVTNWEDAFKRAVEANAKVRRTRRRPGDVHHRRGSQHDQQGRRRERPV